MVVRAGSLRECAGRLRAGSAGRGFTLVELLVVAAIVAVLIGILIPAISGVRNSARRAQTASLINTVSTAASQFRQANRRMPGVFTQDQLSSPTNATGFTQMENAILDLAGGVAPEANLGEDHVFEIVLNNKAVRVNTRMVAASGGPGYLPLVAKGLDSKTPEANGLAPARPEMDQVVDLARGSAGKLEMPDILDSWGHPILLWTKNEYAGESPLFARLHSESEANQRRARFYWMSNQGYLGSRSQARASALGSEVVAGKRERSLHALLGNPAMPDPFSGGEGNVFVPMAPRGDFILHSAGRDGTYMPNGGEVRLEYRYSPGPMSLMVGLGEGLDRHWRNMDGLDDQITGGN